MITTGADGVYIDLHVITRSRRPGVLGIHDDRLKLAVAEPPERGKANKAVTEAVADLLGVPRSAVSLVAGSTSRQKRVFVRGVESGKAGCLVTEVLKASP